MVTCDADLVETLAAGCSLIVVSRPRGQCTIVPRISEPQILDIMLKIEELRKAAKAEAEAKAKAEAKAAEPTEAAPPQEEEAALQGEAAASQEEEAALQGEAAEGAVEKHTQSTKSTVQAVIHGWKVEFWLTRECRSARWRPRFHVTPPDSQVLAIALAFRLRACQQPCALFLTPVRFPCVIRSANTPRRRCGCARRMPRSHSWHAGEMAASTRCMRPMLGQ